MRPDRRTCRAPPAQRRQVRPRLVATALSTKVYFDGGCRPNPGPVRVAAVIRGTLHLADGPQGSSGDAEWRGLVHAIERAIDAGERDIILLGDSAGVIAQASGKARARGPAECQSRLAILAASLDRLRFRHIKRNQNLAGIALDRDYERGFAR